MPSATKRGSSQPKGPGKSAGGSEVRAKLGGCYLLKEEELFLLKSFMSGMKNSPTKTMIKRTVEGRVLTAGEHQQVLDSIIEGLGVHARDCEELEENRKNMRAAAATMIKESKKIRSRLDNQESESEEGEGYEDEGVSEDEATQSDIDFIDDTAIDATSRSLTSTIRKATKKLALESENEEEDDERAPKQSKHTGKNAKGRKVRLEEIDEVRTDEEREEREETEEREDERESDIDMSDVESQGGFIPLAKKKSEDVSGSISSRKVLLTGSIRKRYENTMMSSVIGIGPGSMKIETELNEDGTLKKRTQKGGGYPPVNEASWYFYKGSLAESGNSQVPLKSGIRQTDSSHYDTLCTDITVRAFSQGLWTHKGIRSPEARKKAAKRIIAWLQRECSPGVLDVLEQVMGEVKQKATHMREEEYENKRKALENFEDLKKRMKK